jgi:nucleoid DNA-binding protein
MADNAAKPMSKSAVYQKLAEDTGLSRKQVGQLFDALSGLIKSQLGKKGPGVFKLPGGLIKLKRVNVPARKAGIKKNPFKPGEMMDVKAKPAHSKVKALTLKSLKDMVK